jgi:hypothetical protein
VVPLGREPQMRWLVFACLALTLSADAPRTHVLGKQVLGKQVSGKQAECVFEQKEPGELDGHWWIRTSHCERLLYRLAYADGKLYHASVRGCYQPVLLQSSAISGYTASNCHDSHFGPREREQIKARPARAQVDTLGKLAILPRPPNPQRYT